MLIRCGLLFLFLSCVRTTEFIGKEIVSGDQEADFNRRFSFWPSVHNAARLLRIRREAEKTSSIGQSEGGEVGPVKETTHNESLPVKLQTVSKPSPTSEVKIDANEAKIPTPIQPGTLNVSSTAPVISKDNKPNATSTETTVKQIDLNNPGVLKRGFIVFGGFALLAIAYFIFYRKKSNKTDTGNTHNTIDANQFRYGVLQSEDRRDNMELSRVPLTMESDDDEDEDLEIFDLEQKKKSLSYVNLQTNDEDIVFSPKESTDNDKDNLLLDIEDATSDTLINWSSNGSKSIL